MWTWNHLTLTFQSFCPRLIKKSGLVGQNVDLPQGDSFKFCYTYNTKNQDKKNKIKKPSATGRREPVSGNAEFSLYVTDKESRSENIKTKCVQARASREKSCEGLGESLDKTLNDTAIIGPGYHDFRDRVSVSKSDIYFCQNIFNNWLIATDKARYFLQPRSSNHCR